MNESNREFNALAERILLTMLRGPTQTQDENEQLARSAVDLADAFLHACRQRHEDLRNVDGLTPDEVDLLHANEVIKCIKSVRERSSLDLKQAKALVDKMREQLGL